MKCFAVCVAVCVLVAVASATKFNDCGSSTGQVSSVEVSGCPDGQDECTLKRGSQPTIEIKFSAKGETKSLKAVVHGVIGGVPIPFPVPQSDACKSGVTCPVQSGENYTYNNKFNVRNSYPPVAVTVKYELKDDNQSDMACVEIPCKIE